MSSAQPQKLTWLSASSGLGLSLARAALAAGHKVIATSRNPLKTPEAVSSIEGFEGGRGVWLPLDVSSAELETQVETCLAECGGVDVCVNNAGYGSGGALEDITIEECRRQMETNFFGPLRIIKALIPHFRSKRSGTIINVTSTEGIAAAPGLSLYASSKFALEALSESLSTELAELNIRTLIVEPGGMRTRFLAPSNAVVAPVSEAYKGGVVQMVLGMLEQGGGKQMIDPEKAAKRIVEAVEGGGEGWPERRETWLRLPLGREVMGRIEGKVKSLTENLEAMRTVGGNVEFGG